MKSNSHYSISTKVRLALLAVLAVILPALLAPAARAGETAPASAPAAGDKPVNAILSSPGGCSIKVQARYCHELPPNPPYQPVPVDVCYWVTKTVQGTPNPAKGCCEVTLSEADFPGLAGTYCFKGGAMSIGPVYIRNLHGAQADADASMAGAPAGAAKGDVVASDPSMITVSYPNGLQGFFSAAVPLAVTRDMENALIVLPQGAAVQFTSDGLNAKFIDLRYFDQTAFDYEALRNGFQLQSKVGYGLAYTTLIVVDGNPFYLRFVFVPGDQTTP